MTKHGKVMGPVDCLLSGSRGTVSGKIAPELLDLEKKGIIRVIDLVMILKDAKGKLMIVEAKNLEGEAGAAYRELAKRTDEWFSEGDIEALAIGLPNNTSAGLLLFENRLGDQVQGSSARCRRRTYRYGTDPAGIDREGRKTLSRTRRCLNMRGRGLMLVAGMKMGEQKAQQQAQAQAQQQAVVEQARQEGAAQAQQLLPHRPPPHHRPEVSMPSCRNWQTSTNRAFSQTKSLPPPRRRRWVFNSSFFL